MSVMVRLTDTPGPRTRILIVDDDVELRDGLAETIPDLGHQSLQAATGEAALSNATAGYVVQWLGYPTGFLYLAGVAGAALVFVALLMPETRQADDPAAARTAGAA